jgi:hypothetical protein
VGRLVEEQITKEYADLQTLLFFAQDPTFGMELWMVQEEAPVPFITLEPPLTVTLERDFDTYVEPGYTAYDPIEGTDISPSVVVVSNVNTSVAGVYQVTYNVTNSAGTPAQEVTRTVIVEAPSSLCDVLDNYEALLADFRSDFAPAIASTIQFACNGLGVTPTDLAGIDPGLDDEGAIELADDAACTAAGDVRLKDATFLAFDLNRQMLATLGIANPGYPELQANRDILAVLAFLSGARRAGVKCVLSEAGIDTTGLVLEAVSCNGDCYPAPTKGPRKEGLTEPYSTEGDYDGDGVPNGVEYQNVLAAGGNVHDFAVAATDPTMDGTEIIGEEPPDLCEITDDLDGQLSQFKLDFGVESGDMDGDGIPQECPLGLVKFVACDDGAGALHEATLNAFEINWWVLSAEAQASEVSEYREILAVLLLESEVMQSAVLGVLSNAGISLTGDYEVVTCDASTCLPASSLKGDTYLVSPEGAKAINEPYSGEGDLDGDGVSNQTEYANVIAAGGGAEYFVVVATDPTRIGTESVADRTDINRDTSVNAVDVQLVINGVLGISIGSFFADVDITGSVDAVDVQLVINGALGLLTGP